MGVDYLIKAGMHEKSFLSILYLRQGSCLNNPDDICSTHFTCLARLEQIENLMSTTEPGVESKLLKILTIENKSYKVQRAKDLVTGFKLRSRKKCMLFTG